MSVHIKPRTWLIWSAIVLLTVLPLWFFSAPPVVPGAAPGAVTGSEAPALFGGSDDRAQQAIGTIAPGYRPWFTPMFTPASAEIASLLFALQAAIGAGVIGYWLGLSVARERARGTAVTDVAALPVQERMRIDAAAYASRWQTVAPSAKAGFALAGVAAAWIAYRPVTLAVLAGLLVLVALAGARVPPRTYVGAMTAPLGFLLLSCATMLVTPGLDGDWHWATARMPAVIRTALRSLAVLAALLGFVLCTPLPDLFALLRRLRVPESLLDLMALCYRMLFVFQQAWEEGITAQSARLGHRSLRSRWRSMGLLAGQMAVQVWQRAAALQAAADARAYQGQLRFLPAAFPNVRRQNLMALLASAALLALALGDRV